MTSDAQIVQSPAQPGQPPVLLTKKQLASRLKRSVRWIEIQTRDKGLPAEERTDRQGRRRYDWEKVQAWLASGQPNERPTTEHERISALERQVAALQTQAGELQERAQ